MANTNKHKLFGNRLLQYSALSGAFILGKPDIIFAEVVYTNVEPDVVLDEDDEGFFLDFNDDLDSDVHFLNVSNYFEGYWTSGSINYVFPTAEQRIKIMALGNSIAGSLVTYSTYSSGTIHRIFPYALEEDLIDNALQFQNAYNQTLNFRNIYYFFGTYSSYGGNWFPESIDHYLGIRFNDADEITHYGWIRCDVKDDGRTLVIKDYAYETEPNYPIIAGDTTHYVNINTDENQIDATAYSFGKDIYVISKTFQIIEIKVYDLTGREINNSLMQKEMEIIDMSKCVPGVYFVKLIQDNRTFDKKVIIE
ncbi:MAG TPA: T9SS type A sorting domain-containing protein [Chitinophagales bacterium]|nr:T9SS type A sorting domain-containing protein [Chitinophagales bacterium]